MPRSLMQVADVARLVNLTTDAVRAAARANRLRVALVTPGGVRLFDPRKPRCSAALVPYGLWRLGEGRSPKMTA